MPLIKVKHVISFTCQDPKHTVKDLVEGRGPWLNLESDRSIKIQADLQLEKSTKILYLDIGNAGSAMIGVEVGRSAWPITRPYVTLIPTVTFMTRSEVMAGQNRSSVRMFNKENVDEAAWDEEWDRVRILCMQPFRTPSQFGISMIKMYSESEVTLKPQVDLSPGVTLNKKSELMAKLSLSNPKKSELSDRIKLLETSWHSNRRTEVSNNHTPNSPLSRGGQLLARAAKIPTHQESVTKKSDLECESLDYLISLKLSANQIDHLMILDVRKDFEKKRSKQLTVAERKIFRDIAVDYVTRRLEILENQDTAGYLAARGVRTTEVPAKVLQQKRKLEAPNIESNINEQPDNGFMSKCKNKVTVQENGSLKRDEENQEVDSVFKKYKFGRYRNVAKPSSVKDQETDKEETQISKCSKNSSTPDKEKEGSFRSRNALALLDAHVTDIPPKKVRKKKPRKTVTKQVEQQSLIGQWITPLNKLKVKKENKEFQYSSQPNLYSDSDDSDIDCIGGGESDLSSTPKGRNSGKGSSSFFLHKSPSSASRSYRDTPTGNRLGSAPSNKFNTMARKVEESRSSHQKQSLVDCPICSKSFPAKEIEAHAASCCATVSSDSDSGDDANILSSSSTQAEASTSGLAEECPVCGVQMAAAILEAHATQCASSMFD
ncbi:uncharacterized protein LOC123510675 [Portunus trituberculatus]|uniref:uncharacterized protein LOC123510675 n=1 Tax=Portunus trituberculatus TaxID=210409 RepID=UPI001E1D1964|nr:uncharacterized protein LOC123510675 [Portunus trituberculatus]